MLELCLTFGVVLFLIKNTNVLYHYLKLVGYPTPAYDIISKGSPKVEYLDFLLICYPDSFLVNLVYCPFCLGAWFAAAVWLLTNCTILGLLSVGVYYLIILIVYYFLFCIKSDMNKKLQNS